MSKLTRFEAEILYAAHRELIERLVSLWISNANPEDKNKLKWHGDTHIEWYNEYKRVFREIAHIVGENPHRFLNRIDRGFIK